jgi:hypothetical protein
MNVLLILLRPCSKASKNNNTQMMWLSSSLATSNKSTLTVLCSIGNAVRGIRVKAFLKADTRCLGFWRLLSKKVTWLCSATSV